MRRSSRAFGARAARLGSRDRRVRRGLGGEPLEWGRLANEHPPVLRTHDRYGERIDEIEFHPAWDSLLRLGLGARLQSLPWVDERPGAHVARAALFMLLGQVEAGVGCPLSMTFASVPALRTQPELAEEWIPRLTSGDALRDGDDRAPGWLGRACERDDRAPRTVTPGCSTATSGSARRR